MRIYQVFPIALALILSACGGGGGGGGDKPGPTSSGSLTLSTGAISFVANSALQTPASEFVTATVSTTAAGTLYLRVVSTGPAVAAVSNVSVTGPTTGQGTVVPASPAALGPGVHSSTITVTACMNDASCNSGVIGTPQTITVTYTIRGVALALQSSSFQLTLNSTAADYSKIIQVTANPGYSASADVNWLTIAPASGGSGTTPMNVSLVASVVNGLDSGSYAATITFTAPQTNSTATLPITLTIAKPQLDQITPYVAESNKTGIATLRGSFLDSLPNGSLDFSTTATGSGIQPANVTTVSATELRVTYPALVAGTYFVRIHDSQGAIINRSTARLVIVDPPNYAAGALSYPFDVQFRTIPRLIYDSERKALIVPSIFYAGDQSVDNVIFRYEFASSWGAPTVTSYPYLDTVALSADGRNVIASSSPLSGNNTRPTLAVLAPTTLVVGTSFQATNFGSDFYSKLAVVSNGDIMAMESSKCCSGGGWQLRRYSIKNNALSTMTASPVSLGFSNGNVVASEDGMRVVAAVNGGSTADQSIYEYNAASSTNAMTKAPVYFDVNRMSIDQFGNTLVVSGVQAIGVQFMRVYDRNWNIRGNLPLTQNDFVVNRDGSRAYIFGDDGKIHVYDLTAVPVNGQFSEIASHQPIQPPADTTYSGVRLALTPDGHTLFLAGGKQVVILPLP